MVVMPSMSGDSGVSYEYSTRRPEKGGPERTILSLSQKAFVAGSLRCKAKEWRLVAVTAPVQETGQGSGPLDGLLKELDELHTRQRVRRLKAVANMVHSAATLVRPRSSNLRVPCCSLMIPKTGSASCFLSLYASLAAEVANHAR